MSQFYTITDIDAFVESTRVLVYDAFGKNNLESEALTVMMSDLKESEQQEIETVLTQDEALLIAKEFIKQKQHKYTKKIIYIISEKKYMQMIESFNERLVSNMIRNLSRQGLIDMAYDSEINDFVFWVKEDDTNQK
jgi:hypothetical protein